jgi:putative FmdB family regulatory protein
MPFYDYVCTVCGHEIEVVHSVHGHGPAACPKCGSPMKKAISSPTVLYKGTGWARKEKGTGRSARSAPKDGGESKDTKDTKDAKESKEAGPAGGGEAGSEASSAPPAATARKDED